VQIKEPVRERAQKKDNKTKALKALNQWARALRLNEQHPGDLVKAPGLSAEEWEEVLQRRLMHIVGSTDRYLPEVEAILSQLATIDFSLDRELQESCEGGFDAGQNLPGGRDGRRRGFAPPACPRR
jgi:hypothetical protein